MDGLDEGEVDENQLQTSFLLHDASTKALVKAKTGSKRRADRKDHEPEDQPGLDPNVAHCLRAFNAVWGRIQQVIDDVLEGQNQELHMKMHRWICNRQYGDAHLDLCQHVRTKSRTTIIVSGSNQCPRPSANLTKQLHTALLFLGGIDSSDHQRTFDGLLGHLREQKCHVSRLTSLDFSAKAGLDGVLRVLFRQLIDCNTETTDMDILLAWHLEPCNRGFPVVIVIENPESCETKILGELIMLLSDWKEELPMILVMGLATTGEALSKLLPANALVRLHLWRFSLKSPPEMLEVVMRAVVVDSFCAFQLSHGMVAFLYSFFQGQDLTVTAITRALKIASMEHFWNEPLSFLCGKILKINSKSELEQECLSLPQQLLDHAAALPSAPKGIKNDHFVSKEMAACLWQFRAYKKTWAMGFSCLQSIGKHVGIEFSELLCEALLGSSTLASADEDSVKSGSKGKEAARDTGANRAVLQQLLTKLIDMPLSALKSVLEEWRSATIHEDELNKDICHLLSNLEAETKDHQCFPKSDVLQMDCPVNVMNRSQLRRMGKQQMLVSPKTGVKSLHIKAQGLLHRIIRQFLVPPVSLPFHEIFCLKDVNSVKKALIGQTRTKVHLDLLYSQQALKCACCPINGTLTASLHDTALVYGLAQVYGDIIDVRSWYQSFMAICTAESTQESRDDRKSKKRRGRKKKYPRPSDVDCVPVENVSIEARFTQAVTELQLAGLLQLPKKGQADSLHRICL